MFSGTVACVLYAVQLVSLLLWSIGAWQILQQQKTFQHAEWHRKAGRLFVGYCVCELFRIMDCGYTDFNTGFVLSVWGVVPWWVRAYSWVVRDVIMFRGICVYLEHALVWTHSCMDCPVPRLFVTAQKASCYFGNAVFFVGATLYMMQNDQFWQPVCAMGQIPPNICVAITCYYLSRCLKNIPDCEELRHALVVNNSLLVSAFTCMCVFLPWAVPKMMDLYDRRSAVHPTIPSGTSVFSAAAPSFLAGNYQIDLFVEMVETTVGWCGFLGLRLPDPRVPGPGERLVLSSEEIGKMVATTTVKKTS